jgi:hypothetical protein
MTFMGDYSTWFVTLYRVFPFHQPYRPCGAL